MSPIICFLYRSFGRPYVRIVTQSEKSRLAQALMPLSHGGVMGTILCTPIANEQLLGSFEIRDRHGKTLDLKEII